MTKKNSEIALVTGGAGFIGSNLVDKLIEENFKVVVIDNLSNGKKEYINPKAEFHKADIRELKSIKKYFRNVDYVFHLAAQPRIQPSIKDPLFSNDNNINGALNVLLAARDARVKKFIYSASSSAYGDQAKMPLKENMAIYPKNPYAAQKYFGEVYCRIFSELYGLKTICLRYFNVYGPRQKEEGAYSTVIAVFLRQKKKGRPMTIVGDGTKRRDFTYVSDVVGANILAAKSDLGKGEVINIGTGKNFSVNQVAEMIGGKKINIPDRPGESKETLADISLAKKLLGWKPKVNLSEGIQKILEYKE
ncbi:MAG: SDR family oxidoreductase [Candidatus Portnoybacteria bacterium]|nr:SDR family oxidoreductase [Candidatus Portnoybacteria bacterium]